MSLKFDFEMLKGFWYKSKSILEKFKKMLQLCSWNLCMALAKKFEFFTF